MKKYRHFLGTLLMTASLCLSAAKIGTQFSFEHVPLNENTFIKASDSTYFERLEYLLQRIDAIEEQAAPLFGLNPEGKLRQEKWNNHRFTDPRVWPITSDFRFIVHCLPEANVEFHKTQDIESLLQDHLISASIISHNRMGTWAKACVILDVPYQNIIAAQPTDMGLWNRKSDRVDAMTTAYLALGNNLKPVLVHNLTDSVVPFDQQYKTEVFQYFQNYTPEAILSATSPGSHNEIAILGHNPITKTSVRIIGIFFNSAKMIPYPTQSFAAMKDYLLRYAAVKRLCVFDFDAKTIEELHKCPPQQLS